VTTFNKLKIQHSDGLQTNWKYKIPSLFCISSLLKTVTILFFQFVEGGYYFVFSVCGRRSLFCIFNLLKTVTMLYFHKLKTQNSDRLETNWKYKIVTVFNKLKIQNRFVEDRHYFVFSVCWRPSLFCVFGLWKTVTILYFQLVEGGHYFVFSVCWRRSLFCIFSLLKVVTILYFQFVEDGNWKYKIVTVFHKPKTQNSDRLETNWKSKIVTVFNKRKIQNSDGLQQTENTK
jgi:hypothetical protein